MISPEIFDKLHQIANQYDDVVVRAMTLSAQISNGDDSDPIAFLLTLIEGMAISNQMTVDKCIELAKTTNAFIVNSQHEQNWT